MALAAYGRLLRAGFILAREGVFAGIDPDLIPGAGGRFALRMARLIQRGRGPAPERITTALNRLGPSYVKLGQFLATRADIVGHDMADMLGSLRDEIAPFPDAEARAIVERALGASVDDLYLEFSPAVAAASIAQVHAATIVRHANANGESNPTIVGTGADMFAEAGQEPSHKVDAEATEKMAVKVLRPGVRRRFARDLETFYAGARLVERLDPASHRLRPVAVVDTLARSVALEMDLRLEAAALSETAEHTAEDEGFRVPSVNWERTARDVLTMEWVDGIRLSDTDELVRAGHDLKQVAQRFMQAFLRQALRDGFFHADMHQGNFFVDDVGDIVAVDFGIMGRLGRAERRFLAEILYGFITRNYRRVAEVHFEAGYVPDRHTVDDFAQAIRAIGEPIHGQAASEISMARLLTLLFEVTEIFDMQTRPELLLVQKTMVVVEGVCRDLDPDFDMWATSEPIVASWIERHLGPAGQMELMAEGATAIGKLASELPRLAERAERLSAEFAEMGERGIRLDPETIEGIGRSEARSNRWGKVALWVLALGAVALVLQAL